MKAGNVSVIIPTYRGAERLRVAVDSVLSQTYDNFDIYVVDDNDPDSTDRTKTSKIVKPYLHLHNFHYLKHDKNKNGAAARNTGLKACEGEYITFLDDDDYIYPNRLGKSIIALSQNSDSSIVFFNVNKIGENNKVKIVKAPDYISSVSLLLDSGMMGTGSNLFMKREVFEFTDGFDERYVRYQDVEFMSRALSRFKAIWVDEVMVVKSSNGVNNRPNIYKLAEMQDLLHEDMLKKMGKISEAERKNIIQYHANSLFMKAMSGNCSKKEIDYAKERLKKIRRLNLKEKLCYSIFLISPSFYIFLRKIKG